MKALTLSSLTVVISMVAASALAQNNTDDARAMAARDTARQERESWIHPPVAETVAPWDYMGQAHQRERVAQWHASQIAVRACEAHARSRPLPVNSEQGARAEAQRALAENALAERAVTLRSAAATQSTPLATQ